MLPPIIKLIDNSVPSFRESIIPEVTRYPYNHLAKDKFSLTLEKFQGRDVETQDKHHEVTPELLARKWGCGLLTARKTLQHTTQLGVRSAIGPLTRRYRTNILQLHYRRLVTRFYTDTMFSKTKSLKGNTCAQVYTDGEGFVRAYPMTSKL